MGEDAKRDQNSITTLLGVSSVDGVTPVRIWVDPVTHRVLVDAAGAISGSGTANEITYWVDATTLGSLAVATYPSLTELSYVKGVTSSIQTQLNAKASAPSGTINEIAYFNSASTVTSLAVATYPSLTELSYVKGVTSAIQTQIGNLVAKSLYDANTILYATTDNTPVALVVAPNNLIGRINGDIVNVPIDSDLSSTSAGDDTVPSAKATKAMGDLKLPLTGGTMTGAITTKVGDGIIMPSGSGICLKLPESDAYCTGNYTDSFQSGYTAAAGDLVFMGSSSKWLEVDADAVATCKGLIGIALEAKSDTQAMKVALPGSMVRFNTWNWTVGATLYAGETLGSIQETIPTGADAIIRVIGFAVDADTIYFNPSPDQQSTVA